MTSKTHKTIIIVLVLIVAGFTGGAVTYAQFTDTETAEVSITAGTWNPTSNETVDGNTTKAISFVAFCVVDGSSGSVTITGRTEKAGGDPINITYTHTFGDNLTSVVNKAGPVLYEDPTPDGTVVSENVILVGRMGKNKSGRQPSEPCGDSAAAIKFEDDAGELEPGTTKPYNFDNSASNIEKQRSATTTGSTVIFGAQSIENTNETEETNESNATSTETTAETSSTTTETATETPEIETPTPTPTETPTTSTPIATPAPTPTPTETETTTEASVDVNHILENSTSGNETTDDEDGQ